MSRDWLLYLDDLIFAVDPQIVWKAATQHAPRMLAHAKVLRERFDRGGDSDGK